MRIRLTCVIAAALVAAAAAPAAAGVGGPSHAFSFANPKLDKKAGTATLPVSVASAGAVTLAQTKSVRGSTARAPGKARVLLAVRARGAAKRKLLDRGKVGLRLTVTYAPDGGTAKTQSLNVTLVKTLKKP
jgi:hypothetical protein